MSQQVKADICVIGAGSGGLSVAAGCSQMGAKTVLIEKAKMGGDCLNYGCVPSKAMLAAGKAAQAHRAGTSFGVKENQPSIDYKTMYSHIQGVIGAIAPNDSVERFEGLGVQVIKGAARFVGNREILANDTRVTARRFVVATGSSAAIPPIPGIDTVPYYTNETIFSAKQFPKHLIIIGGGPIGCELAQAHRRLGAEVTILEMFSIMPKDDPELVAVVRQSLLNEGIIILEGVGVENIEKTSNGVSVTIKSEDIMNQIEGSDLLVAAGRRPNLDGLDLEAGGITYDRPGIKVDARLRTSNKRVFAIGDCAGSYQFTHVAGYHAGIVIRNALFRLPAKVNYTAVPWVTYTSPELAQVGLTESEARQKHGSDIRILRWPFHENDRAQAEHQTNGM
ncbi:MAG: FAD-dependent oxidoreductase, partial [Rhodospirillales bacterium]|nr:FAD-dependent oxidoreductase [Rhodospirillales bacterium]